MHSAALLLRRHKEHTRNDLALRLRLRALQSALLLEHRAADRQANGENGHQQQAEAPGSAAEQVEVLQGQGLEIRNRR